MDFAIETNLARMKMMSIALECLYAGNLKSATTIARAINLEQPQALAPQVILAITNYYSGNKSEALQTMQLLSESEPGVNAVMQSLMACLLIQDGAKDHALSILEKIELANTKVKPGNAVALFIDAMLKNEIGAHHGCRNPASTTIN